MFLKLVQVKKIFSLYSTYNINSILIRIFKPITTELCISECFFCNKLFNCLFLIISGISDVAKDSGIVVNPSRANESARIYAITKFVKKYVEDAKLGQKLVFYSSFQTLSPESN
jgi:hypothetical protein